MRAAVFYQYGDHTNLSLVELPTPKIKPNEVLLDVYATSINGSDWEFLTGSPAYARIIGLTKPRKNILGSDISGVISQVGHDVTSFSVGDEVFCDNFEHFGGFAEQVAVQESKLVRKPASVTHELASSVPQSGVIALQGLKHFGDVTSEMKVLINGAGGGGGAYAIQFAKAAGARVTAVDFPDKQDFMKQMGADTVIDCTQTNVTETEASFDKILDFVGGHSVSDYKRIMSQSGTYTIVGGKAKYIFNVLLHSLLRNRGATKKFGILAHKQNEKDIMSVVSALESHSIKSCIGNRYLLENIQQAFKDFGFKKTHGKVIIRVRENQN
jgi:NADPH:quinone reductase-like Zn-dependent oxidoreductase